MKEANNKKVSISFDPISFWSADTMGIIFVISFRLKTPKWDIQPRYQIVLQENVNKQNIGKPM